MITQLFSFNGLSFNYKNDIKDKYFYELGKVSGFREGFNSIGTMLIGAQISNYNEYDKQRLKFNEFLDKGDIKVAKVPIKTSWNNEPIYSKRNGFCPLQAISAGTYVVKIDSDNLPAILSAERKLEENIKVEENKTTRVEFPLISSVGNISGSLKIIDDFKKEKILQIL